MKKFLFFLLSSPLLAQMPGTPELTGAVNSTPPTTYTLTVNISGSGSVTGTNCTTGIYNAGTPIGPCAANTSGGSTFTGWSSTGTPSCSGTGTCPSSGSFSIGSNSTITATFTGGSGPLWSGILATARADPAWPTAGVQGGIPSGSWLQCGPTIAAYSGSPSTIVNALNHTGSGYTSCGANTYVSLGAGTFNLTGAIRNVGVSNTVLRGQGNSTILNINYANSTCQGGNGFCAIGFESSDSTYPNQPPADIYNWTEGYSQGTTAITLSSGTNIHIGTTEVVVDGCDTGRTGTGCTGNEIDNGNLFECADGYTGYGCSVNGPDSGLARTSRFEMEAFLVTGCTPACGNSGSTVVTLDHAIEHPNWALVNSPQAYLIQLAVNDGVEDLTVNTSSCNSTACNGAVVSLYNMANSWVKGVAVLNGWDIGIWVQQSVHITVQSNYVYNVGQSLAYSDPTGIKWNWTQNLIVNNIVQDVRPFIQEEGPASGNVIAYNYGINSYTDNDNLFAGILSHSTGDDLNLYEGNVVDQWTEDQIHGSHMLQTTFRNLLTGWESCGNGNCGSDAHKDFAVNSYQDLSYSRYENAVGNVLGTPGGPSSEGYYYYNSAFYGFGGVNGYPYYIGSGNNAGSYVVPGDAHVIATLMRWGNYDLYNNATLFCTAASTPISACQADERGDGASTYPGLPSPSTTFPASFWVSSRPSWYSSSIPFPAIGPDVTGGNVGVCGGTLDASGQFGGVAATNSSQCAGQGLNSAFGGHVNAIPAMACYLNTMGGPPDGSGSALNFNEASCYP